MKPKCLPEILLAGPRGILGTILTLSLLQFSACAESPARDDSASVEEPRVLPPPSEGPHDLRQALRDRRSLRSYSPGALSLQELGDLLWAAQGRTHPNGFRTAPSAGATFPLETYVVVGEVEECPEGFYRYDPDEHTLIQKSREDQRDALAAASHRQTWMAQAPVTFVFSAVYERTTRRYRERGRRYVHMEVGHAAQNLLLEAEVHGLGGTVVGAFSDNRVKQLLGLPRAEEPLYLIPVGRKSRP